MRAASHACLLILTVAAGAFAQEPERHAHGAGRTSAGLGVVAFANSGAPGAQEPFLRGLALLHSFEYRDAAEGFREAQAADAGFAMAFWGEALTYSHLLWGMDDAAAARRVLQRLGATPEDRLARAGTPRERAYGAAIEALYADGDLPARVNGFAAAMRRVAEGYPDDVDAAAFTSLALMFAEYVGNLPPEQRTAARSDAIALAERVFTKSPQHPGGAHYLIHATDDPAFAARGLEAARRYAAIAPDAEHALHMPSHIFVQLGFWDDAVASNERAWAASKAEVADRKLSNAELSFHSLQWLQYGYLQQGRHRASRDLIATARQVLAGVDLADPQHVDARHTVGWLEFVQAANTGQWSGAVCTLGPPRESPAPVSDRERSFRAIALYQAAIIAVMCGPAEAGVEAIRARVDALAPDDRAAALPRLALRHARLLAYVRGGAAADLEALLADAPRPERAPVGPPPTLRTDELLGEARLKAGRPREAIAAYERALELTPNRSPALLGLARARAAAGDRAGAAEAYRKLLANWKNADGNLPALAEARDGAGARVSQ